MEQSCVADEPFMVAGPVEQRSLRVDVRDHLDRHKWIQSQKAGRDLGQEAVRDWIQKHWYSYLKARWLEHLEGQSYWIELNRDAFGLLRREFPQHTQLLDRIVERMKIGCENLEIICWAVDEHLPVDDIRHILKVIDINSLRLYRFFSS